MKNQKKSYMFRCKRNNVHAYLCMHEYEYVFIRRYGCVFMCIHTHAGRRSWFHYTSKQEYAILDDIKHVHTYIRMHKHHYDTHWKKQNSKAAAKAPIILKGSAVHIMHSQSTHAYTHTRVHACKNK